MSVEVGRVTEYQDLNGDDENDEGWRPWCKKRGTLLITVGVLATIGVPSIAYLHRGGSTSELPFQNYSKGGGSSAGGGSRLRIINGCKQDPLWIANFAFQAPAFPQDMKLAAGASHDFAIPDEGLAATRFWAKWGCDAQGANCLIGESGGPGESCGAEGCAPPVDSKFEATFGCMKKDVSQCARNPSAPAEPLGPTDWWDVSQVDGWTLPYKVELSGLCPMSPKVIDCSELSLTSCPNTEDLGDGPESLRLKDIGGSGKVVGCYSPCAKLTYSQWGQGHGYTPESAQAQNYCCPTPPITPEACSKGPVIKTQFVQAVHKLCPSVYAYAYDDGMGLAQCPAGVRYDVTFYCPS